MIKWPFCLTAYPCFVALHVTVFLCDAQVLSIVTVAVAFVAMAGSIFGMNLYFNVQTTPPVSLCL